MAFARANLPTWEAIQDYSRHGWLYRGEHRAGRELRTSLERSCDRHGVPAARRPEMEEALFREFRRAYHQYGTHVPNRKAVVEWFSLMQHYGAPTRLLDFTYSPYIATYFATEQGDGDCSVWAVNAPWAARQSVNLLRNAGKANVERMEHRFVEGDEEVVQGLFLERPYVRAAWPINPFRLNERLRIQEGAFLIVGDVSESFVSNFEAMPGHDQPENVIEIVIAGNDRQKALESLFGMGISRTSLFPGLDGFSKSLDVYHPVVHKPIEWT
jgi:hypothetical protein